MTRTRCTAKFITALLPPAAVDATREATTCCCALAYIYLYKTMLTYLFERKWPRVDNVKEGCKPRQACAFDHGRAGNGKCPSFPNRINKKEKKDSRYCNLDRLE